MDIFEFNLDKRKLSSRDDDFTPDQKFTRRATHRVEESEDEGEKKVGENHGYESSKNDGAGSVSSSSDRGSSSSSSGSGTSGSSTSSSGTSGGSTCSSGTSTSSSEVTSSYVEEDGEATESEEELVDDVFESDNESSAISVRDIIGPILLPTSAPSINPKEQIAPIGRKPNYLEPTPSSRNSDAENDPPSLAIAVRSHQIPNGVRTGHVGPLRSVNATPNALNVAGGSNKFELREMFVAITQADLDRYDSSFLLREEGEIRKEVSGMCHSLRFWLGVKFCLPLVRTRGTVKPGTLTYARVCNLLGIHEDSIRKFLSIEEKRSKTFADHGGYSPFEFNSLKRCTHPKNIREWASNLNSDVVQRVLNKK